jgi:radical SAM protein with 4Fe4S-binding SPASM domain
MIDLERIWPGARYIGLKSGTHRYDGKGDLAGHRFHLRVDPRSKGVLMVDASKLIFLNGTALDYTRCYLEGRTDSQTLRYMKHRYRRLDKSAVEAHYHRVKSQILSYIRGDNNVIQTVGASGMSIGSDDLPSPYRMDLALTYRCQNDCGHCYNESKDKPELTTDQWMSLIDKLWDIGIPHVVFTGGEPTLYQNLEKLVERSEMHGQITGMITNGRNLRRPGYVKRLIGLGLDHVQITVLSHMESVHDELVCSKGAWKETVEGLKASLAEDLYVSTNTTIMRANYRDIEATMRFLVDIGVKNIAFNSIIRSGKGQDVEGISFAELDSILATLRKTADEAHVNLIWYSPTPYCEFNPVNNGLGIKQCTACSINMAVEPDGTVLPCQSYYEPLGNILSDPWDKIWNNRICRDLRERKYLPEKCADCKLIQVCGGGCPLSWREGQYVCLDRHSSM